MVTVKPPRGKLPLMSIVIAISIFTLCFSFLLYSERLSFLSSNRIFGFKHCAAKKAKSDNRKLEKIIKPIINEVTDDRFEFDPEECDVFDGKWVFNRSIKPLYSERTCPYLDRQVSCVTNGRNDSDYLHWVWRPHDCILPRFNPEKALRKLQGKRLMFVGDSLQRGQWQSFVCLVQSIIPPHKKSMKLGRVHSIFKAEEYNATIEFYWAPFLVESNSDTPIINDPNMRILKVDSIDKHAQHWLGVDILVFNTYVWWMSGLKIKSLWGSFANGQEGFEELDTPVSYTLGLKTWANWVDSTIDPNKTRVLFITMSPTHQRSEDWGRINGTRCYNETRPVTKRGHWGTGSNKQMMNVVSNIVKKMKVPITFINITQLSEYRIDAHSSIYTELGGKLLTDEQKADPSHYADCIHWCLPGLPDTWNEIFYAYL